MIQIPEAVIDTLNGLLEAEVNSIFCFVMAGSPYLNDASAELRQLMQEMDEKCCGQRKVMARLIESVGGVPRVRNRVPAEEQYLSFLSLKFLLPKLVTEKELLLTRFENAQATIGPEYPHVLKVLEDVHATHKHYLGLLKTAASEVTGGRFDASVSGRD